MPGQLLQTEAFVLLRRPPTDSFQGLTIFSAEHGNLLALQRVTRASREGTAPGRAKATAVTLDLFDEAAFQLESSNQGQTWFVKEANLVTRHASIGRSYESLQAASSLAALIARNPGHEENRPGIAGLLRAAFEALQSSARPDIVFLKSLYRFARDEGYPLKQQWFPTLPTDDRIEVSTILNQPLSAQHAPAEEVLRLRRHLENFLRGHTEILLE